MIVDGDEWNESVKTREAGGREGVYGVDRRKWLVIPNLRDLWTKVTPISGLLNEHPAELQQQSSSPIRE